MNTGSMSLKTVALAQQEALRHECQVYLARVAELMRLPERAAELNGYLRLIDNTNQATIALARSVGIYEPGRKAVLGNGAHNDSFTTAPQFIAEEARDLCA